jgi:hypothetical protein
VIKQIDCNVLEEREEGEWRFKETASNEKVYTGRTYPSREYAHTVTLSDGRQIAGSVAGVIYVVPGDYGAPEAGQRRAPVEPEKFLLHKRDKGDFGQTLTALKYVKQVRLGEEAFQQGKAKAQSAAPDQPKPKKP